MDPLLSIQIYHDPPVYRPGDLMRFDYQIDAVPQEELTAVEASILWMSEGKGDEDIGVHFFERRVPADAEDGDLRPLRSRYVTMPNSPLSYQGDLFQLRWLVRIRIFLKSRKDFCVEQPFVLTTTATPTKARVLPHES